MAKQQRVEAGSKATILNSMIAEVFEQCNALNEHAKVAQEQLAKANTKEMIEASNLGVQALKEYYRERFDPLINVANRVPTISKNFQDIARRMQKVLQED